jgi:hypothetical protein
MRRTIQLAVASTAVLIAAGQVHATINFTGGTAHLAGGSTGVTNNWKDFSNVVYYEQDGYRFDFAGNTSAQYVGTYYEGTNDVLHAHFGRIPLKEIRVSKIDGSAFDLVSLVVISNVQKNFSATGLEQTFLNASHDGTTIGASYRLPSENWGPDSVKLVTPGTSFTHLKFFNITTSNYVTSVGIDDVTVHDAVASAPEPLSLAIWGSFGVVGMAVGAVRRRPKRKLA